MADDEGGGEEKGLGAILSQGEGGGWALAEAAMRNNHTEQKQALKGAEVLATILMFAANKFSNIEGKKAIADLQVKSAFIAGQVGIKNPLTVLPHVASELLAGAGRIFKAGDKDAVTNTLAAEEAIAFLAAINGVISGDAQSCGTLCDMLLQEVKTSPLLYRTLNSGASLRAEGFAEAAEGLIQEIRVDGSNAALLQQLREFARTTLGSKKCDELSAKYTEALTGTAEKVAANFSQALSQGRLDMAATANRKSQLVAA